MFPQQVWGTLISSLRGWAVLFLKRIDSHKQQGVIIKPYSPPIVHKIFTVEQERKTKMKTISVCLLIIFLSTAVSYAEIMRKFVENKDGTHEFIFYNKGKEIAKQTEDKNGTIIKTTGIIPDGIVKQYYDDGSLFGEWNYKGGKLEGTSTIFYTSGEVRIKWNYKDNTLEGISREYYKSGKLKSEKNYKSGELDGITKFYYESGEVKAKFNYKDGKRDGVSEVYYKSGKLHRLGDYKNGKLQSSTTFDEQ